ncbi:MAG: hypothetical protein JSU08_12005 [Acidobacteria bacterium]|nr:hypothetical protein [Acidobacteriota bacterium]
MTSLRHAVLVLLLLAIAAATGSAFTAQVHLACVTQTHDCDDAVTAVAECCCHASDAGSHDSTLPEQRVELTAAVSLAVPVLGVAPAFTTTASGIHHPVPISPRRCLLDLPTLLATLLI